MTHLARTHGTRISSGMGGGDAWAHETGALVKLAFSLGNKVFLLAKALSVSC